MDAATKEILQGLSDQIEALETQLEAERAGRAKVKAAAEERKALPSVRGRKPNALPNDLKRAILKDIVERIVLSGNAIVIDRKGGAEPLVGEVMPRKCVTSSPWRFLDVEWDD
jgi:hypothetical protein